jgi:hypothetical protein
MIRIVSICLVLAPVIAQAQIFRCDTEAGPVFSDEKCGVDAQLVILEQDSAGVASGPPEEVRQYLRMRNQERAEQREDAIEQARLRPATKIVQVPVPQQHSNHFPGYWYPQRPGHPVHRPVRPIPELAESTPSTLWLRSNR